MPNRIPADGSRRPIRSAAIGVLVLVWSLLLSAAPAGCGRPDPPSHEVISNDPALSLPPLPPAAAREAQQQVADPVRLRIPAIGVDAPVEPLVVDAHGVLPPPSTNHGTGWWRDGPEPGERGPAVIVGHVDSYRGPAVFFRLAELGPGDEILVDRRDGSTAVFVTQRVERHGKDTFPTRAVYGGTPDSELRLITCGGEFDYTDRRYLDNIIAYAPRAR
jgi:hypothetical protein